MVKNVGFNHSAFSGIVGGVVIHGKIALLPKSTVSRSSTNATGSHATKPSMRRMVGRDHRAVVMRCAAVIAIAADENVVKKSQLTWNACQARALPLTAPTMKIAKPTIASSTLAVASRLGIGRVMTATTSSRDGMCASCPLIIALPGAAGALRLA